MLSFLGNHHTSIRNRSALCVTSHFATEVVKKKKYSKIRTIKLIILPATLEQVCVKQNYFLLQACS